MKSLTQSMAEAEFKEEQEAFAAIAEKVKQPGFKVKNWMRNAPCPCQSGKKFKKCCMGNHDQA